MRRLIAGCFVAIETSRNEIAGFYTLSATGVSIADLPPDTTNRLPRYPVLPAALIGRLAIDSRYQKAGLGAALLADAAARVLQSDVKALALVVDAKDEKAAAFYAHQGFAAFKSQPARLWLPLAAFRNAAKADPRSQQQ